MTATVSLKSSQSVTKTKRLSSPHALDFIRNIETKTGIELLSIIRNMINKNRADSISIRKDRPRSVIFISRNVDDISITIEKASSEFRVSIPHSSMDTLPSC